MSVASKQGWNTLYSKKQEKIIFKDIKMDISLSNRNHSWKLKKIKRF